jgi:hypothetical protein
MYCLQLTIRLIYLLAALQQEHITPQGATPSKVKLVFFYRVGKPKAGGYGMCTPAAGRCTGSPGVCRRTRRG